MVNIGNCGGLEDLDISDLEDERTYVCSRCLVKTKKNYATKDYFKPHCKVCWKKTREEIRELEIIND